MPKRIDPRVEIGRVQLRVSDLQRSLAFYSGVLGFDVAERRGDSAAVLSAGASHPHIGLTTGDGHSAAGAATPVPYRFAIRYPDRASLGDALRRLRDANVPLEAASDHGVGEAIYLRDPDGNALELYRDRPRAEWPRER